MLPSIPRLSDYDISPENGFLPSEPPVQSLSDPYYRPWEDIVRNLQALILSKRLRTIVDRLPVLSTRYLRTEGEWRRAHMNLAFMAHAYIWGGDQPEERVPPAISAPFLETCKHLEIPPVANYASVVLWNWATLFDSDDVSDLTNLRTLQTFTGSLDESWFYLVSVAIESRAAPLIPLMLDAFRAVRANDQAFVTEALRVFAETLDELGAMLVRMYENCDPHVFYHRIRPFLAGSKNMADAGLPDGVQFDADGSGTGPFVQYAGGSNAQSSIIQFFDLALGVEHRPTGSKAASAMPTSNSAAPAVSAPSNNFIHEMRQYMPGPHRRFLTAVEGVANIRPFINAHQDNRALTTAFDACLAMLRAFRDKHIQMVSRYIIVKSRETRSGRGGDDGRSLSPEVRKERRNIAVGSTGQSDKKNLKGTGGTALIPFLKQARDETGEPAIDAWARRLLNNGPGDAKTLIQSGDGKFSRHGEDRAAKLKGVKEGKEGDVEIVGLAGVWSVDDSEGGICHW